MESSEDLKLSEVKIEIDVAEEPQPSWMTLTPVSETMVNLFGNSVNTIDTRHEANSCFPLITAIKSEPQENTEMCQAVKIEPFDWNSSDDCELNPWNAATNVKSEWFPDVDTHNMYASNIETESVLASARSDGKTESCIANTPSDMKTETGIANITSGVKTESGNANITSGVKTESGNANTTHNVKTESGIGNTTHDVKTESGIVNTIHDVKTESGISTTVSNDYTIIVDIQISRPNTCTCAKIESDMETDSVLASARSDAKMESGIANTPSDMKTESGNANITTGVKTESGIANITSGVKTESGIANTTHDVNTESGISKTVSNDDTIIAEIQIPRPNTCTCAKIESDMENEAVITQPVCDVKTVPITNMMERSASDAVTSQPISGLGENRHRPQGDEQECGEPSRASRQVPVSGQEPLVCDLRGVKTVQGEHRSFPSSECDNSIVREHDVQKQKMIQAGHKPFACDVCTKVFTHKRTLKVHKRIHTGAKPFACNVCPKAFGHHKNLTDHQRIHTGEKPFACSVCDKTFPYKKVLNVHLRIHTGKKPFACGV